MTYSLTLCCIIIALLGCARVWIQEHEIFLLIFFIPILSCSDCFPASLSAPFWFGFDCKDGRAVDGCLSHRVREHQGWDRSLWNPRAVKLFPLAGCLWGLQHSSLQNTRPGSQACVQGVCRGSSVPSSLSILHFMGINCPGQTLRLMAELGSEKPASTKIEMQGNQWATGTNSGKFTMGK